VLIINDHCKCVSIQQDHIYINDKGKGSGQILGVR